MSKEFILQDGRIIQKRGDGRLYEVKSSQPLTNHDVAEIKFNNIKAQETKFANKKWVDIARQRYE